MRDWPVVVTNQCAEVAAEKFGLAHADRARTWLYQVIKQRGQVTHELPPPVATLRSGSGYFMVADDVVVLPLMPAKDGTARWIATDCAVFPSYRRRGGAATVDPFQLSGADLVQHVGFSRRAVEQFQERSPADPNPEIAREELRDLLAADSRATAKPPAWCRARNADFYLVSGDEYVLPMSRQNSSGYEFEALSCVHRAGVLFGLRGADLAARCRFGGAIFAASSSKEFLAALSDAGRLSAHRPSWAKAHPAARFWVIASDTLAAPAAWQHHHTRQPLLVLDVAERLVWRERLRRTIGRTFGIGGRVRR
ncbi:MAG: hypothetical protein ACRDTU_10235 [Micromonosporaceae bacterium]